MSIFEELIGKYVIVRTRDAGVHAGVLKKAEGRGCLLHESRRLWCFQVPVESSSFLSGVSIDGLDGDSRLGAAVESIILTENCEIIKVTPKAEKSIREWPICERTH